LSLSMFKSALSGWFSKPRGFKDGKLERDPLVLLLLGCPGHGKTYLSRNAARSLVGEVCLSSRSLLRFVRSLLRVCEVSFALKLGLFCLKTRPPLTLMHTHTTHTHTHTTHTHSTHTQHTHTHLRTTTTRWRAGPSVMTLTSLGLTLVAVGGTLPTPRKAN